MRVALFTGLVSALIMAGVLSSSAQAARRDDFPSCYAILNRPDLAAKPARRELFVIVDQTVPLNRSLKRSVYRKVHRFLKAGDRLTLLTFSAFAKDRYAAMSLTGKLDYPLAKDVRYRTSIPALKKFDHCMQEQRHYVDHQVGEKLKAALDHASTNLPKTELAGSLAQFGRTLIGKSKAGHVDVLIVSDMLENSDVTSFYRHGHVKSIDAGDALKKIAGAGFISNWGNARVYVIGAGFAADRGYRGEDTLKSLEDFWRAYFQRSHARLAGWGQPELMTDLQ